MKAWREMIEQFQKAGLGSNAPEYLQMMFAPMQQQLDLMQKALETQAEFYRELTEQVYAPRRLLRGRSVDHLARPQSLRTFWLATST
jgi:hypothetical protein